MQARNGEFPSLGCLLLFQLSFNLQAMNPRIGPCQYRLFGKMIAGCLPPNTLIKTQRKLKQLSGNVASKRSGLGGIAWHAHSSNLRMLAWSCQPIVSGRICTRAIWTMSYFPFVLSRRRLSFLGLTRSQKQTSALSLAPSSAQFSFSFSLWWSYGRWVDLSSFPSMKEDRERVGYKNRSFK